MALIHIYCGEGKGKTTAALGLAVRIAGSGGRAVIVRFLKGENSGEVEALRKIPGITVIPCRKNFGFTWKMGEAERAEASAEYERMLREGIACACGIFMAENHASESTDCAGTVREHTAERIAASKEVAKNMENSDRSANLCPTALLVLDEVCAAVESGLLDCQAVTEFLDRRPACLEVALTGRRPPEEWVRRADYITEMKPIRHPYEKGIKARRGIEY